MCKQIAVHFTYWAVKRGHQYLCKSPRDFYWGPLQRAKLYEIESVADGMVNCMKDTRKVKVGIYEKVSDSE